MTEKRWKSNINITGNPYIYDRKNKRQYWLDDEHYLITCILNNYEKRINELETILENFKWSEIPTIWSEIIDPMIDIFKRQLMSIRERKKLECGDGWVLKKDVVVDGLKYDVEISIMQKRR